ncbi:MAG: DUF6291 domain-containing protein [Lachnospiraceae bacterium]|nr:DUF6291 domain-containing protein [Lachnospiraceae bacterium]
MEKNSFIFYTDYKQHLELLSNEQRGILIMALTCYQLGEDLPEMDSVTQMAFSFIRQRMDIDNAKYEETCKARSEAGKKGGRPRKAAAFAEDDEKANKANGFFEKQTKAKKADNDNDNDYDHYQKENDKKKKAADVVEYFDNADLDKTFKDFIQMRQQLKKPMTEQAIGRMIIKIKKLSGGDDSLAVQILERSIIRSWTDIYSLNDIGIKKDMQKNKFNNYTQRDYDTEVLEKKLLGSVD